jgi:hypothetical protein
MEGLLELKTQYFINMLLYPIVYCGKYKVKIHFDGWWMEPR